MSVATDVMIVGGGAVGAALALALARGGLRIALIESRNPPLPANDEGAHGRWDARVYALSPGSREFLSTLAVWPRITVERIAPIFGMQVWGDDHRSCIEFDALQAGRDDLGCIVEAGRLQQALWEALHVEPGITVFCPARCESLALTGATVHLRLADASLTANLVVGADGPDSWVRRAADLAAESRPYDQTAVVANFACEQPHEGIARQWFREDGVLAWLPLPGKRISIVWSAPALVARELLALDSTALCTRVAAAGNNVLGQLTMITPPASFPLRLVDVPHTVKPGLALVGDAAHVVHPLAGQGVNLGFRDAEMLVEVLLGRGRHEAPGDLALLRRYERARREDWLATKWLTDGLQALFHPDRKRVAGLRNLGLKLTDRLPGLKRRFMAHAVQ